ncbi:MAG: ATP-binding protein [Terracidiphilus sp.]|nr:ATP-binding protein [Terracidiphilus sp.]MDR3796628.1 ATP-binding protein [Terracidiphilus sp.]
MLHSEKVVTKVHTESTWNGVERRRVEQVVETLATLRGRGESISEVAHDARNMVAALGLYCDLLEEPGVLATAFTHYAHELRLVAAASRRLVEKLVSLDANAFPDSNAQTLVHADAMHGTERESAAGTNGEKRRWRNAAGATSEERNRRWDLLPALPITNLAAELLANRNLLAALAGPSIALTVDADGGAQAVRLTGEDLTRLLVNLVKNAAEAMPRDRTSNCRIHIGLRERETAQGAATCLELTVEDNGPGIAEAALDRIFTSGFTLHGRQAETNGEATPGSSWPLNPRGLGLAIVRSIVEGAGGRIAASNRIPRGACFTIELPVRKAGV